MTVHIYPVIIMIIVIIFLFMEEIKVNYSKQRNLVLEVLKDTYDHPTAETVYERAHRKLPTIGIATVYRNLNQLAEMGEILRIPQAGGNDRFDARVEEHYHIRCPICGGLTDLMLPDGEGVDALMAQACKLFGIKEEAGLSFGKVLMEKTCDCCKGKAN